MAGVTSLNGQTTGENALKTWIRDTYLSFSKKKKRDTYSSQANHSCFNTHVISS